MGYPVSQFEQFLSVFILKAKLRQQHIHEHSLCAAISIQLKTHEKYPYQAQATNHISDACGNSIKTQEGFV